MNKLFEKGLEFLKLKEKGLTLYEIMKTLNENSKHKQETSTMMRKLAIVGNLF